MASYYEADPYRPKDTTRPLLVSLLLAATALLVLYFAYQLWLGKRETEGRLEAAQGEVKRLTEHTEASDAKVALMERAQAERTSALEEAQGKVRELSAKLEAAEGKLDELAIAQAENEALLAEFKAFTRSFQRLIDDGKLNVHLRRGRMIVELPARVLFDSGSADLTPDGKTSLREVAKVLRKVRNKRFIVGGHTDNLAIANSEFPSNWELSTRRAVNVTRTLIRHGMPSHRLVAAGFGPYDPVATNRSKAGRRRNRRMEIILEPRLNRIPDFDGKD